MNILGFVNISLHPKLLILPDVTWIYRPVTLDRKPLSIARGLRNETLEKQRTKRDQ
jgi:hypothetical protein